jgi:NitT/TauT family transport system permease protein
MTGTHTPPAQPDPGAGAIGTLREPLPRVTSDDSEPGRGRDVKRIVVNVCRVALPVAVLLLWEFASGDPEDGALIDSFYVSKPSEIWDALVSWWTEGILLESIQATVTAMLIGFLLGAILGIIVGIILGSSPVLSDIFRPFLVSLNAIPRLALVPLFILWFGFGLQMKVALVALIVFFLVFYATYEGVRDVEQRLLDVLKVMDASKLTLQMKVRVPSAMAWIIQGLQVSIPYALVAAVTAEIIGSNTGIGYLIQRSAGTFFTAGVFAGIVVLVVVSVVINALVTLLEKRLLRWKPRNLNTAR